MNPYGAQAAKHWQTHLPERFAQIQDPETFFTDLGEEIEQQIEDQARALAGPDPAQESYLDKVGRLNMARLTAESQVLREMLPAPTDDTETAGVTETA
jgi:stalled ribosome rescue protein Dom34